MNRCRRVGTITAGITLVFFGVLFLLRFFYQFMDYTWILSLWPIILILLGLEIILSYVFQKGEKLQYDGGAIAIIILMAVFSMAMAMMEFAVQYYILLD